MRASSEVQEPQRPWARPWRRRAPAWTGGARGGAERGQGSSWSRLLPRQRSDLQTSSEGRSSSRVGCAGRAPSESMRPGIPHVSLARTPVSCVRGEGSAQWTRPFRVPGVSFLDSPSPDTLRLCPGHVGWQRVTAHGHGSPLVAGRVCGWSPAPSTLRCTRIWQARKSLSAPLCEQCTPQPSHARRVFEDWYESVETHAKPQL